MERDIWPGAVKGMDEHGWMDTLEWTGTGGTELVEPFLERLVGSSATKRKCGGGNREGGENIIISISAHPLFFSGSNFWTICFVFKFKPKLPNSPPCQIGGNGEFPSATVED